MSKNLSPTTGARSLESRRRANDIFAVTTGRRAANRARHGSPLVAVPSAARRDRMGYFVQNRFANFIL
jgi:hypothetical protein